MPLVTHVAIKDGFPRGLSSLVFRHCPLDNPVRVASLDRAIGPCQASSQQRRRPANREPNNCLVIRPNDAELSQLSLGLKRKSADLSVNKTSDIVNPMLRKVAAPVMPRGDYLVSSGKFPNRPRALLPYGSGGCSFCWAFFFFALPRRALIWTPLITEGVSVELWYS